MTLSDATKQAVEKLPRVAAVVHCSQSQSVRLMRGSGKNQGSEDLHPDLGARFARSVARTPHSLMIQFYT